MMQEKGGLIGDTIRLLSYITDPESQVVERVDRSKYHNNKVRSRDDLIKQSEWWSLREHGRVGTLPLIANMLMT